MDNWTAEDGELKVFVEGTCEPGLWRKFKHLEVSVVDTRECPGMAVSLTSTQAIEIAHRMRMEWNAEADKERSVRPDGWREPIRGSLRIDRNAPCACGSGRKSKKCCGGGL